PEGSPGRTKRPSRDREDTARAQEEPRDEGPEHEAADMGEERDAAAVGLGLEQAEVRLEQLVQEPEAEEEPRGELDREDAEQTAHVRPRVEDDVGAEDGSDRAARAEIRDARSCRGGK